MFSQDKCHKHQFDAEEEEDDQSNIGKDNKITLKSLNKVDVFKSDSDENEIVDLWF